MSFNKFLKRINVIVLGKKVPLSAQDCSFKRKNFF